MAYTIDQETCDACGACADDCPVEAIAAGEKYYTIDVDLCIDCGACEGTCPSESIHD